MITIKKLADYAGVSVRTLHFYDEKGLLEPGKRAANGYRYYDDDAVIILQQILFFRELGFPLEEIREIVTGSNFNIPQALNYHKAMLEMKKARIGTLLETIEATMKNPNPDAIEDIALYFKGFSEEPRKKFGGESGLSPDEPANENTGTVSLPGNDKRFVELQSEGGRIFKAIYSNMNEGYKSNIIQEQISLWRRWLENFYHYTDEEVLAVGRAYSKNRDYFLFFQQYDASLPLFLTKAIEYHVSRRKRGRK